MCPAHGMRHTKTEAIAKNVGLGIDSCCDSMANNDLSQREQNRISPASKMLTSTEGGGGGRKHALDRGAAVAACQNGANGNGVMLSTTWSVP